MPFSIDKGGEQGGEADRSPVGLLPLTFALAIRNTNRKEQVVPVWVMLVLQFVEVEVPHLVLQKTETLLFV